MPAIRSADRASLSCTCRELLGAARAQAANSPRATQRIAERALAIARVTGDKLAQAEASLIAGDACMKMGKIGPARAAIDFALPIFEANGAHRLLARAYDVYTTIQLADNYYALAMAGARRALAIPGLSALERSRLYLCTALASCNMLDLAGARRAMEEYALPEAYESRDAELIHQMQHMMAGLEAIHACLAGGILIDSTVGLSSMPGLGSVTHYLGRAQHCIDEGRRFESAGNRYQAIWALDTQAWISTLRDGIDASLPLLTEGLAMCGDQFDRVACKMKATIAIGHRLAGRPGEALPWLLEARAMTAGLGRPLRGISFELSLVYEALGRPAEALDALRTFSELHARKAMNATAWLAPGASSLPFGPSPDLRPLRSAMLRPIAPGYLRKALDYIDRNLDKVIRVSDMAAECRVSAKTLQNAFRKYRDATPSEEIRERRLARAEELLHTTDLRIGDIATRVGYSSGSNLTRDYRKRFGAPPSRVRTREDAEMAILRLVTSPPGA